MQPTITRQITQTGLLPGKVTPLGVSVVNMPHVMNVLTRQYADPTLAALREISANALDSHRQAGVTRPIEVTLPNRFESHLTIRDFGVGMSVDFIEERFTQYGDSSKHNTDEIGGFGIGGKAPLAYNDSMIIISVKDGVRAEFVMSRDSTGAGSVKRVSVKETSDSNGVTIKIPARNSYDFDNKADYLFKFWPEGTVLVNGGPPRRHNGIKVSEGIYYTPEVGQSYLVMGGLPYRIPNPSRFMSNHYFQRFSFIAEVPTDAADITPNREALEETDMTLAVLKKVTAEFEENFVKMVKDEILSHKDAPFAWDSWSAWRSRLPHGTIDDMEYNGVRFASRVPVNGTCWIKGRSRGGAQQRVISDVGVIDIREGLFITGQNSLSSYTKSRVSLWQSENANYESRVFFVDKVPTSIFVKDQNKGLTWNDVLTAKPSKAARAKGTFEIMEGASGHINEVTRDQVADWDSPLLLIAPKDLRGIKNKYKFMVALTNLAGDVTIVKLAENRWAKFKRDFADRNVEEFYTYARSLVARKVAEIPASTWELRSLGSDSRILLKGLNRYRNEVKDAEVVKLIDLVISGEKKRTDEVSLINSFTSLVPESAIDMQSKINGEDWLKETYPLIKGLYYYSVEYDEFLLYMNASYEARKDKV